MIAKIIALVSLLAASCSTTYGGRALLDFNNLDYTDAAVVKAVGTALNATFAARDLLIVHDRYAPLNSLAGHKDFKLEDVYENYIIGHVAAHGSEDAMEDDQISAGIAAAASVVASGLTASTALNSSISPEDEALEAIEKAENLTLQVYEENSVPDSAKKASAVLTSKAVHDSSLVLYWSYKTGGSANNVAIFNQTITFAVGLLEPGANQTVDAYIQSQLSAGGSPAIAMAYMDVVIHELHGAVATYQGDPYSTVEAQYEASQAGAEAITAFQEGKTAQVPPDVPLKFAQLVAAAQTVARNKASSQTQDDSDIASLMSSIDALDSQVEAVMAAFA